MTFNIGDKVRVNNSYPTSDNFGEDGSYAAVRGSEGVVDRVTEDYVGVVPEDSDHEIWGSSWLFLPTELDLLEEVHPLTNESVNSPETASENNSDGAPFKVGDLVRVVDYHLVWDGTVGRVHEIYAHNFVNIRNETHEEFGLGFPVSNLELTTENY